MDDFQDELSESFDDDSPDQLGEAERDARLSAFEKQSKQNQIIAVKPKTYSRTQRKKAVRWLGEAGAIEGIPALVKVYRKDKTPGMKQEAAESLGMLKSLQYAMEDPETFDETFERMERVQLYGEFGKRANNLVWIAIEVVLLLIAAGLIVGALVVNSTVGEDRRNAQATSAAATETARPTATPDTEDIVQGQLQSFYSALSADASTYQDQLLAASRGEGQNCDVQFELPPRYALSATWAEDDRFVPVVENLNNVHALLDTVRQQWVIACSNNVPIDPQQALDLGSTILNAQRILRETAPQLESIGVAVPTQQFATSTPVPTDVPEETPTPDLSAARTHILALDGLLSTMTNTVTGPTTTITFYWQQVVSNQGLYREGCLQPPPTIPEDYALPDDIAARFPQLKNAADNINVGLASTRQATTAFYEACNAGEIPENAAARLAQAQNAVNAFNLANTQLDAFR